MSDTWLCRASALVGALGIAAAAFGSHGLEKVTSAEGVRWWAIAAAIQLVTVPAALIVGLHSPRLRSGAGWALLAGVFIFSGSLYAMALGGPRVLGAVTPIGGLFLMGGWLGITLPPAKRDDRSRSQ